MNEIDKMRRDRDQAEATRRLVERKHAESEIRLHRLLAERAVQTAARQRGLPFETAVRIAKLADLDGVAADGTGASAAVGAYLKQNPEVEDIPSGGVSPQSIPRHSHRGPSGPQIDPYYEELVRMGRGGKM